MSNGKTILSQIADAGCDYKTEKIEVTPAAHSVLAGLVIDQNAETNIPGLFAAGENNRHMEQAGCLATGSPLVLL